MRTRAAPASRRAPPIPKGILEALDALPTIPRAAIELNRALSDPKTGPEDIAKVVRPDPALTANLLRVVNSAASGVRREVTSVPQAAVMLGQRGLQRVASMALLARTMPTFLPGYGLSTAELWSHCAVTAVFAEHLARSTGAAPADLAFTGGLLHDVGKLAVGAALEAVRAEVLDGLEAPEHDLVFEEREHVGVDHSTVGAELARRWGLPAAVAAVAAHHHAPLRAPAEHRPLVCVVHVANGLAHCFGFGADVGELHRRLEPGALGVLSTTTEALMALTTEALDDALELAEHAPGGPGEEAS